MSFNPGIDENYFARTERNTENLFTFSISIYTLIFYILGFIITVTMTVLMLWIYYNTKRIDIYKNSKSNVFSIALTAGILMLYILALDIAAVVTLKDKTPVLNDRNIDDNDLPYIVLSFDAAMAILWGVCWILTFVSWSKCTNSNRCNSCNVKQLYLLQAILIIGPIFMMVTHLPYIAISYLNDASYASSIFIYYTVVTFVIFGSLKLTYGTFQQAIISGEANEINYYQQAVGFSIHNCGASSTCGEENEEGFQDCRCFTIASCIKNERRFKCVIIVLFVPFILILIGMTTAALVVVPISRAFSDAPNRLLGFYETVIVVAGAYFAYMSFFNNKPTLETAIKKRGKHILRREDDSKWQQLSEDERVAIFYDRVVELAVQYDPQQTGLGGNEHGTADGIGSVENNPEKQPLL